MAFAFTDEHIEQHARDGFTIFREILPPSLLHDLRVSAERGREICLQVNGPQAQRLQPVYAYDLDLKPFQDFAELPSLRDAVTTILSEHHTYGDTDAGNNQPRALGIFYQPVQRPFSTRWHRDWRDNIYAADVHAWAKTMTDPLMWNQYNCALYDDISTWVVPGSHGRPDLPRERNLFPTRPVPMPVATEQMTDAELERQNLQYCRSMPGAVQAVLHAGDFMLYRNCLWHIGNYSPHRKRATLHEIVATDEWLDWIAAENAAGERRKQAGVSWMNPYEQLAAV